MKWCAPLQHIFKEIKRHGRHLCIMRIEKNRHPVIIVYYGLVVVPLSCSFRNGMASWVPFHHIYKEMERNGKHIPIMSIENGRHNPIFVIKNWWGVLYHFKLEMQWNGGRPTIFQWK